MTACSFSCCFTLKDPAILIPKTTSGTFTQCTVHLMTRIAFSPSKSVLTYMAWLVHYPSFRYKREDEADDTSFHFVGYATLYPFFCWPDKIRMRIRYGWGFNERAELGMRGKWIRRQRTDMPHPMGWCASISQFLILPPFQQNGHGSK